MKVNGHDKRAKRKAELYRLIERLFNDRVTDPEDLAEMLCRSPQRIRQAMADLGLRVPKYDMRQLIKMVDPVLAADVEKWRKDHGCA